jgi:branched-chain amino acid transport system ATP-binding protein
MLETRELGIRFGGHQAVDRVSCQFVPGSLTAIVGPNGAGKTTYFNLISGQLRATSGSVWLNGQDLSGIGPAARAQRGLGRAFQLTNLFPLLTVQENVRLALQAKARVGLNFWSVWNQASHLPDQAREILKQVAMLDRADELAATLAHGEQRKLEVALLLAMDPSVFMFDEPTAGMSLDEVPVILELMKVVKARKDRTVLLVEHKLDVVHELADRIVVLHNGALVADGEPKAVMSSAVVQQAYLGVEAA